MGVGVATQRVAPIVVVAHDAGWIRQGHGNLRRCVHMQVTTGTVTRALRSQLGLRLRSITVTEMDDQRGAPLLRAAIVPMRNGHLGEATTRTPSTSPGYALSLRWMEERRIPIFRAP